jgi:hypothetical protein
MLHTVLRSTFENASPRNENSQDTVTKFTLNGFYNEANDIVNKAIKTSATFKGHQTDRQNGRSSPYATETNKFGQHSHSAEFIPADSKQ